MIEGTILYHRANFERSALIFRNWAILTLATIVNVKRETLQCENAIAIHVESHLRNVPRDKVREKAPGRSGKKKGVRGSKALTVSYVQQLVKTT